jgi:hypothetical protein
MNENICNILKAHNALAAKEDVKNTTYKFGPHYRCHSNVPFLHNLETSNFLMDYIYCDIKTDLRIMLCHTP